MQAISPAASFLATLLLLAVFLRTGFFTGIQDIPNQRSLHTRPIPRIGGLALMAGLAIAHAVFIREVHWGVAAPVLLLIGISVIDDIRELSAKWRLLAHFVAASIFVYGLSPTPPGSWGLIALPLTVGVVWMINLYNFMDGADGLAGGMAVIGFSVYGVGALMGGDMQLALLGFSIAGAAFGFLFYNFSPAQVFMGDAGSVPLGFLAAALGLWGWKKGVWPIWFPILVFSPFIVDTTVTLLKRLLRGERIWEAHKDHYYQRLVQIGWGHRKTAWAEYVLMVGVGACALLAMDKGFLFQGATLAGWGLIYMFVGLLIERSWKTREASRRV